MKKDYEKLLYKFAEYGLGKIKIEEFKKEFMNVDIDTIFDALCFLTGYFSIDKQKLENLKRM